jgi:hypothetical protein
MTKNQSVGENIEEGFFLTAVWKECRKERILWTWYFISPVSWSHQFFLTLIVESTISSPLTETRT